MPFKDPQKAKQYRKDYYHKHSQKLKERAKLWFQAHRERHAESGVQWRRDHFEHELWVRARNSARQRNLEFSILVTDVHIPETCPYLGIVLTRLVNGGRQDSNASLDRIDNTKGYVRGNIQVISSKANFMKRNASLEELRIFAQNILMQHPLEEQRPFAS